MMHTKKSPRLSHSMLVGMLLVLLCLVTGAVNPAFFSFGSLFDALRNMTVVGIFGMGVLIVMLSGGIDVSFPAIAAVTSYVTVKYFVDAQMDGSMITIGLLAVTFGILLGLINGAFVTYLKIPALIVTLGTSSLFYGFNLFFVGSQNLFNIPKSMAEFARTSVLSFQDGNGMKWALHPAVLIFVIIAALTHIFLTRTLWGRGIYALGGNRDAAERVGLPLRGIELLIFGATGGLAALAGIIQVIFARSANPGALLGTELDVIAAVVLGGASVTGGRGSVMGALVGLAFIAIMKTSMVMLGVPAAWQKVFVGIALLFGIGLAAWQTRQAELSAPVPFSTMEEEHVG